MGQVFIVAASRSPIGSFGGSLSTLPAHQISAEIIKHILQQTKLSPQHLDEVILGQVLTAGMGQNPARQAMVLAGLPYEIPAMLVNKVCGSGLKAVQLAYQAICLDEAQIVIAGGQENMSLAPHCLLNARSGQKMGDWPLKDSMVTDGLWDAFHHYHMGQTAENIAKKYALTRQQQDEFAAHSQQKAQAAMEQNRFKDEIVPLNVPHRKNETILFETDEFARKGVTAESLSVLRPAFNKEGTVTAGNASGINDGSAILMIASEKAVLEHGLKPFARIVSCATAGVPPELMGTGPIPASQLCLKKAGWSVNDLDLIEANEAFAAQALCVNQQMDWDVSKVNVNGGAIALGHPIGASGARILVTLVHEMSKRKAKKALATLCIGGGQGIAMAIERV